MKPSLINTAKKICFIILLVLCTTSSSQASKWGGWGGVRLNHAMDHSSSFHFEHTQKWKEYDQLNTYYAQLGATYKLYSWMDLTQFYRLEEKLTNGSFETEHRFALAPRFKWNWGDFSFRNRNQFEYRIFQNASNFLRYRNRLKMGRSFEVSDFKWVTYLAAEIFYDFGIGDLNQTRYMLGIAKSLSEELTLDLYYVLKRDKSKKNWSSTNIFGFGLGIHL